MIGSAQDMGDAHITSYDGENSKDHQRNGHDLGRFMDMMFHMLIRPGFTTEGHEQGPEHVEGGHPRSHGCHQPEQEMAVGTGKGLPEDLILAEESGEAGDTGNRQGGKEEGPEGDGGLSSQPSHLSHIQFSAQGVHHAPRPKEEKSFEEGMGHEVEDPCAESPHAHTQEHISQLADGRIGQDFLDIVLAESDGGGIDGRGNTDDRHNGHGDRCHAVEDIAPGDHIDPCCHHGGGMDEGADRRGTFHGIGKPDIEGDLCRFPAGPNKEQNGDGCHGPRIQQMGIREDLGEIQGPDPVLSQDW